MLKNLLFGLLLLLVSSPLLAKGSLTLRPGVDTITEEHQLLLGFSVYQALPFHLGYNGWLGGAVYEDAKDKTWAKFDNSIETYTGPFAFGIGTSLTRTPYGSLDKGTLLDPENQDTKLIYATMKWTIWQ